MTTGSHTRPNALANADLIVEHYERHAQAWDADRRSVPWLDRPYLDRFVALSPDSGKVLDLGCGGGEPVAATMTSLGFTITGVDSAPTMISLCRRRMPSQHWIVADMRTLALGEFFDGVLAWDSFFHLKPDDQVRMFPIFALHTAPGGILMFNAGSARGEAIGSYRGDPLYHASLDDAEYRDLLNGSGFELIEHIAGGLSKGGRIAWIARRR
jgi:trans-aconitate methyltransferase